MTTPLEAELLALASKADSLGSRLRALSGRLSKADEQRLAFMRENRDKILSQSGITGHQAIMFLASCGMTEFCDAFMDGKKS
jgi:hypothetical protein